MYFFRTFKKSTAPYEVHNLGLRYIKIHIDGVEQHTNITDCISSHSLTLVKTTFKVWCLYNYIVYDLNLIFTSIYFQVLVRVDERNDPKPLILGWL